MSLGHLNISLSLDTVLFQQNMAKAEQKARQFADRTTQYLGNIEAAANNINKAAKWDFRFDNFDRVKSVATSFIQMADASTELNPLLRVYQLTFNLKHSQAVKLTAFFTQHGGVTAFQFRDRGKLVKVVCPKWSENTGKTHTEITCTFEEVV